MTRDWQRLPSRPRALSSIDAFRAIRVSASRFRGPFDLNRPLSTIFFCLCFEEKTESRVLDRFASS